MASSRKSRASNLGSALAGRVASVLKGVTGEGDRVVLGLSGGVDSVVLLDVLAQLAPSLRFKLSAVHVNHQLSPNAQQWARFCGALCRTRKIPLKVAKVTVARGNSVEAAARAARHEVFRSLRAACIVLAHNQDDQVETLLLQLLRGAGVRGLAAMPVVGQISPVHPSTSLRFAQGERHSRSVRAELEPALSESRREARTQPAARPVVVRPLLDVPRSEIEAYARQRGLEWVEDESNAETYFMRNFLRHEVLPAIESRYPGYRATLARSARHFADAAQLLNELGAADAAGQSDEGTLSVAALRRLAPPRARNLLRYFLAMHRLGMSADRLDEALRQIVTARQDAGVRVELEGAALRRHAGRLYIVSASGPLPARPVEWHGEREIALPELGGILEFTRGRKEGISLARLRGRSVTIGVRRGGERLKPDCRRPRRSLKNLLQEARIPPWRRERMPLLFCDGELVWAAGVGVDCAYRSAANEPALRPVWRPS